MRLGAACALVLWLAGPAWAQNHYALEIVNVKPVGTAPTGMDGDSRLYRAYTGLTWTYRVGVIGGQYPYTFALTNAPAGMSIRNASTGETCGIAETGRTHVDCGTITWTSPAASASNITVTVTDADGSTEDETWSITVGTSGYRFLDAVSGVDSGSGGIGAPWRTVAYAKANSSANDIWYFRTGTYGGSDMGADNGVSNSRKAWEFSDTAGSAIWLEYPGDAAVLDLEAPDGATTGQYYANLTIEGPVYMDGFEITNCQHFCLRFYASGSSAKGPDLHNLTIHHTAAGWTEGSGSNQAPIMWEQAYPNQDYGTVLQNLTIYDSPDNGLKFYSQNKMLLEDSYIHDVALAMELKSGITQFTVRANHMDDMTDAVNAACIAGNMNSSSSGNTFSGEVAWNLCTNVTSSGYGTPGGGAGYWGAIDANQDGGASAFYVYRNTLVGRVLIEQPGTGDGPFAFTQNVIVNEDNAQSPYSYIYLLSSTDDSVVSDTNNLKAQAATGVIDSSGKLTGSYRTTYLGTRGYEQGGGGGGGSTGRVRIRLRGQQ